MLHLTISTWHANSFGKLQLLLISDLCVELMVFHLTMCFNFTNRFMYSKLSFCVVTKDHFQLLVLVARVKIKTLTVCDHLTGLKFHFLLWEGHWLFCFLLFMRGVIVLLIFLLMLDLFIDTGKSKTVKRFIRFKFVPFAIFSLYYFDVFFIVGVAVCSKLLLFTAYRFKSPDYCIISMMSFFNLASSINCFNLFRFKIIKTDKKSTEDIKTCFTNKNFEGKCI